MQTGKTGFIAVLLSIASVLTILGCFVLLSVTTNKVVKHIEENVVMIAYFSRSAPESEIEKTKSVLEKDSRFREVKLISNVESAKLFESELGEDYIKKLGSNPLPWSMKLYVDTKIKDEDELKSLVNDVKKSAYVYEVDFQTGAGQLLKTNRSKLSWILIVLSLGFLGLSVLLINNAIRLQIYSDRFKVKSMQLVGATEKFIQAPYIKRAALIAIVASLLATILVSGIYQIARKQMRSFDSLNIPIHFSDIRIYSLLFVTLLISGLVISLLSSYIASKKYLRSKIDELY